MKTIKLRRGFGSKIKRVLLILIIFTFFGGTFMQTTYFTKGKAEVYSQLREKYLNEEEDTMKKEEQKEESKEQKDIKLEKNLNLSLDSDLRVPSKLTAEEINYMLEGTNLHDLGDAFERAEKEYNVNALYMMGLAALESSWGNSRFAVERNNLFGWNAVDSNPNLAKSFDSKKDAILFVASKLEKNYLTDSGRYFEGYTPKSIDVHYCTDEFHAAKIINIVSGLTKKLG